MSTKNDLRMPPELMAQLGIIFLTDYFIRTIFSSSIGHSIIVYLTLAVFYINPILENEISFINGVKKYWLEILSLGAVFMVSYEWAICAVCALSVKKIVEHYIVKNNSAFNSMMILGLCLITFATVSIRQFENLPECNIKNGFDAIWWSICTITTVGYGDKFPITDCGKIIALILMVSGIGLFGTLIGYVSTFFIDREKNNNTHIDTIEELSAQIADLKKSLESKIEERNE